MQPPNDPNTLDYKTKVRLLIPPRTPQEFRWLACRIMFPIALAAYFSLIVFFGTHLILYGRLTCLTPADFAPHVQQNLVPIVQAIKQYQSDHGSLPNRVDDLVPNYLPTSPQGYHNIENQRYYSLAFHNKEAIIYDFTPGAEHWEVRGYFASGPIPVPPVFSPPPTFPATPK